MEPTGQTQAEALSKQFTVLTENLVAAAHQVFAEFDLEAPPGDDIAALERALEGGVAFAKGGRYVGAVLDEGEARVPRRLMYAYLAAGYLINADRPVYTIRRNLMAGTDIQPGTLAYAKEQLDVVAQCLATMATPRPGDDDWQPAGDADS